MAIDGREADAEGGMRLARYVAGPSVYGKLWNDLSWFLLR